MPKKKKEKPLNEEILENEIPAEEAEDADHSEDAPKALDDDQALPEVKDALEDYLIPVEEKLELVKAAWESSEVKAAEYLDGWQRAKAEFSNYKKRVIRDRDQVNKDAVGKVVKNYLSVVDDLERALKDKPAGSENEAWANGIELIYRKLVTILENDGVTPMNVMGEMFDPNLHEAVAQIASPDHKSGQIIDVIQTGYIIGERVLRPARVCIAS